MCRTFARTLNSDGRTRRDRCRASHVTRLTPTSESPGCQFVGDVVLQTTERDTRAHYPHRRPQIHAVSDRTTQPPWARRRRSTCGRRDDLRVLHCRRVVAVVLATATLPILAPGGTLSPMESLIPLPQENPFGEAGGTSTGGRGGQLGALNPGSRLTLAARSIVATAATARISHRTRSRTHRHEFGTGVLADWRI